LARCLSADYWRSNEYYQQSPEAFSFVCIITLTTNAHD
jgi:hypothetical protein